MAYRVEIRRQAAKEINRIGLQDRKRIQQAIDGLASNPHPVGSKKLHNRDGWRIRVGHYRVIYRIEQQRVLVLVLRIGHRREVYR